jgi:hypothetical protein
MLFGVLGVGRLFCPGVWSFFQRFAFYWLYLDTFRLTFFFLGVTVWVVSILHLTICVLLTMS